MQEQISRYLDTLDLSKNTIDTYRYALKRFVEIVGDDAPLNAETFETFLSEIKDFAPSTKQIWRSAALPIGRQYPAALQSAVAGYGVCQR